VKRLRHPVRSIREPFGKAGLIVAMIALVAALGGSALAAKGALTGKQKKEVEKIAKKYAGKPGPAGAAGKDGTNGTNGSNGGAGTNGVSVTTAAASNAECPSGGVKLTSAGGNTKVCNGTTGFTETLPPGKTETGAWSVTGNAEAEGGLTLVSASFSIPLAAALEEEDAFFIPRTPVDCEALSEPEKAECEAEQEAELESCPGSAAEPLAAEGAFCAYTVLSNQMAPSHAAPATASPNGRGASATGATLVLDNTSESIGFASGTWAVTAP
jgi:hypothetical protein